MANAREHRRGLAKLRDTYERLIDGWLRRTPTGWQLTDNQGRDYPLSMEDGAQFYREAHAKIDELFASLEGKAWYMMIPAALVAVLGLRMVDQFALYGTMPVAVYFLPCLLFVFKDVIAEVQFAIEMNRWRSELAARARAACGREAEGQDYSLLKDQRLGAWIGWALLGPSAVGLLIPIGVVFNLTCFGAALIGTEVLRRHYGVTG